MALFSFDVRQPPETQMSVDSLVSLWSLGYNKTLAQTHGSWGETSLDRSLMIHSYARANSYLLDFDRSICVGGWVRHLIRKKNAKREEGVTSRAFFKHGVFAKSERNFASLTGLAIYQQPNGSNRPTRTNKVQVFHCRQLEEEDYDTGTDGSRPNKKIFLVHIQTNIRANVFNKCPAQNKNLSASSIFKQIFKQTFKHHIKLSIFAFHIFIEGWTYSTNG